MYVSDHINKTKYIYIYILYICMCNFAETKNRQLCPMPYVCICVYYMQYISFALCPIRNCPPCYILPMPYSRFPNICSLCMQYSLFLSSHPLFIIPYSLYMPYSRFMYSIFHACALYSILPILIFLIQYYLFHMNSYDPFVASTIGTKQRCAVWVAHRLVLHGLNVRRGHV